MRILDLEAKSPLYSHFIESLSGLVTIRAFGWGGNFEVRIKFVPFRLAHYSERIANTFLRLKPIPLHDMIKQITFGLDNDFCRSKTSFFLINRRSHTTFFFASKGGWG